MSRITLNLPPQVTVVGSMWDRSRPQNLDQDMLNIELPGRIFIHVGWYPDLDPNGEYRLFVYLDAFEEQIETPVRSRDPNVIVAAIGKMVSKHLPPMRLTGSPGSSTTATVNGRVVLAPPVIAYSSDATARNLNLMYVG